MFFEWRQLPFFVTAACLMSLQPLLVAFSKDSQGGFSYSVPCSTMLSETLKLLISAVALTSERMSASEKPAPLLSERPLREFVAFMVPGLIYFVNNNCQFFILQAIDPTAFQLLSQMKTIFTGLLFRCILSKKLKPVQWLALVVLACGTAVSELPTAAHTHKTVPSHGLPREAGFLLSIMTSMFSALAGVYNEKLLKDRLTASLHWQNIQLYLWGVLFNAVGLYMKDGDAVAEHGLLGGFTAVAYMVVVCNALTGLSISAVLKYADNIARVYAHAIAMMLTMFVSVRLLGTALTAQLMLAIVLVAVSTFQYNMPQSMLQEDVAPAAAAMSASESCDNNGRAIYLKEEATALMKQP